jgi:uncharacterized protein YjbJ (UPF0337 family)
MAGHVQALVRKETEVTWDQVGQKWTQMRGSLRHRWGRLTEEDLDVIAGKKEIFIGRVQERYSISREEARQRIEEWLQPLQEQKVLTGRA